MLMQNKMKNLYPKQLSQLVWQDPIHWHSPEFKKKMSITDAKQTEVILNQFKQKNTSMIVPLVITPREVYIGPLGFFFTPMISRLKVHFSSGCVTWALVNRNPEGRMKRSYLGGFLVKPGPTNVHFVTILFHCFAAREENQKDINRKEPAFLMKIHNLSS